MACQVAVRLDTSALLRLGKVNHYEEYGPKSQQESEIAPFRNPTGGPTHMTVI